MERNMKSLFFCTVFIFTACMTYAANTSKTVFTVVPWNGYKAAVSLTYDDGDPIHLSLVIPEMQKRKLRGTFFLIAGKLITPDQWKASASSGMEIGNHTMTHRHVSELKTDVDLKDEVDNAGKILKDLSGQPVMTFAYPFVEISDGLRARVEKNCFIARGGYGGDYYYTPDSVPDWYNISSQGTTTKANFETYQSWIDQAVNRGAWTIFVIHAIEGSDWFEPVPKDIFLKLLDYLAQNRDSLWTAPFGEVGAYWKAQKSLEAAKVSKKKGAYIITWTKPQPFPDGVVVKIKVDGDGNTVTQAGKNIGPVSPGIYPVSFDAGEMTIVKGKKAN